MGEQERDDQGRFAGDGSSGESSSHGLDRDTHSWMTTKAREQGKPVYADLSKMQKVPGGERPKLTYKKPKGDHVVVHPTGETARVEKGGGERMSQWAKSRMH